jgi:hypothetical protein
MARTYNEYITGKLSWVRPDKPDPWGNYKATIHPNAESLEKVREMAAEGVKNKIGKDEDGYFVTYRRPTQKMMKGKVVAFTPVELLDGTQPRLPDGSYPPLRDVAIGNGSDGVIKLQVYEHGTPSGGKAKAARLEAIRIDHLIPFTKSDRFDEEGRQIGELDEQPKEQLF